MSLQQELQSVDGEALTTIFDELAAGSHERVLRGELPVEFYAVTGKFAVVEALREATFQGTLGTQRGIATAHEIASGGFMASAALGTYASTHSSPHLETVDPAQIPNAFVAFHNRLHAAGGSRFDAEMDALLQNYPFIDVLMDLVLQDAIDSGLNRTQVGNFGEGTLNAMGTLTTYAEAIG